MNETFEVLFLRQQLDVLGRQLPPRPPLTNADRLQLVWRYRLLRSLLKAIRLSARSRFGVGSTRIWRRLMLEIARLQAAIRVPNLSRLDRGEEGKLGAINSLGQTW